MAQPDILLIGYGNPLRADDGIGWALIEYLGGRLAHDVRCETMVQLTPEVAEDLSEVSHAVFLDATVEGEPGHLTVKTLSAKNEASGALNHHCSPEALLSNAAMLFGHSPQAKLVTICGEDFGYREQLSPRLQESLPRYGEAILQLLSECR